MGLPHGGPARPQGTETLALPAQPEGHGPRNLHPFGLRPALRCGLRYAIRRQRQPGTRRTGGCPGIGLLFHEGSFDGSCREPYAYAHRTVADDAALSVRLHPVEGTLPQQCRDHRDDASVPQSPDSHRYDCAGLELLARGLGHDEDGFPLLSRSAGFGRHRAPVAWTSDGEHLAQSAG